MASDELDTSVKNLLRDTSLFIYGTTRATNGIVERKTARTAFISTEGFPDTLLLKEGGKSETHNLRMEYPDPYIPRSLTFEVPERISAEGGIETSLDEMKVTSLLETFPEKGIEAIAVCLLWSVANPVHEKLIAALIEKILPGIPYTLSSDINPHFKRIQTSIIYCD